MMGIECLQLWSVYVEYQPPMKMEVNGLCVCLITASVLINTNPRQTHASAVKPSGWLSMNTLPR